MDLVFCNEVGLLSDKDIIPIIGRSDHLVIYFRNNDHIVNKTVEKVRQNYDRGKYHKDKI